MKTMMNDSCSGYYKKQEVQIKKTRVLEVLAGKVMNGGVEAFVIGFLENVKYDTIIIDCLTPYKIDDSSVKTKIEMLEDVFFYELGLPVKDVTNHLFRPFLTFLQDHTYDIVHLHGSRVTLLAVMAAAAHKAGVKKVILHSHTASINNNIKTRLIRALGAVIMEKNVDVYFACSRKAAMDKFGRKIGQTAYIIRDGIDTKRFEYNKEKGTALRESLGISEATYVVGHVGRLAHEKNQSFLIEVFSRVVQSVPKAVLLLVGEGRDREILEHQVAENGLDSRVIFTGSVINVQDYLQAMDVFVFPSEYEGFGISAIEAQAAGLPVIVSDKVPHDVDVTGDVEFLRLDADVSVWAETILRYRNHPRRDRSADVAAAGYDISHTVEEICGLYLED